MFEQLAHVYAAPRAGLALSSGMARKPDLARDFPAYVTDVIRLKAQLAEVEKLRDAGKIREARALMKKIDASALCRRVKRFEALYGPAGRD
ncbi:MAG: hypothetical protein JWN63_2830 [Candidatus Acidoferrum typicum]|nr:hypothetical protein [Candidatus Acidoferrum typicum]